METAKLTFFEAALLIVGVTTIGCAITYVSTKEHWRKEAINRGFAKMVVEKPTDTTAKFHWRSTYIDAEDGELRVRDNRFLQGTPLITNVVPWGYYLKPITNEVEQ